MPEPTPIREWHHAPLHKLAESGTYMVTAGTYRKAHLFDAPEKRDMLMAELFRLSKEFNWQPQAWAFMSNHYHVILSLPEDATGLPPELTPSAINDL
jgi:putative transposase